MPAPAAQSPFLPILARRDEIIAAVRNHPVVVVCGETGSGKTTQLPRFLLDLGLASGAGPKPGIIGHTQPRRLAARAVAARIAEELADAGLSRGRVGERGCLVGSKVRFQDTTTRDTGIKLLTDGTLLAELAGDPLLRQYAAIIIDEAHERSLNIDFLLGILRSIIPRRPDLRVVITSATIDPSRFAAYFAPAVGAPVPIIEVSGRGHPVEVRYRPPRDEDSPDRIDVDHLADAVEDLTLRSATPDLPGALGGGPGHILVFLPGEREIRLAADALRRRNLDLDILPLFSRLTNEEQDRIFHVERAGRRRVILATNVAETSLTVPGIISVVDAGLARISRYDPERKVQRLPIEPVSRASANQRAGRCGRIAPGVCTRLYSERSYSGRPAFTEPEVRRTNLASVILQMRTIGSSPDRPGGLGDIEDFPFLDAPDPAAIRDGYETLFELGALTTPDRTGTLTPIGERMGRIPTDPRIARMLLAADGAPESRGENCLREVLVLAAALSTQDPRDRPLARQQEADRAHAVFRDETSDFLTLLKLWDQARHASETTSGGEFFSWCRQMFLSPTRLREWVEMERQLRDVAADLGLRLNDQPATPDRIHRALLTGLITNVAGREGDGSFDYRGVRGNVVQIFPGSVLFKKGPKWIMAAEVVQTSRLFARTVARVQVEWVEELAGHMFRTQRSDPHLDPDTGEPSAWERITMSGIVVVPRRRGPLAKADPAKARDIFLRDGLAACSWKTDAPFMLHNRAVLESGATLEAKLRRRGLIRTPDELAACFAQRIPPHIATPAAFDAWRAEAERADPKVLCLALEEVASDAARPALDQSLYPDAIDCGQGAARASWPVAYALAPGKDEDGVTITVPLAALDSLTPDRAAWLVPGMLPDLVLGLLRLLPKPRRAQLKAKAHLGTLARDAAEAMAFGRDALPAALTEALEVLHGVAVPIQEWSLRGLPPHLRTRIRVVESDGPDARELGVDRDLDALHKKFESRIRQLRSSADRAAFGARGLTAWTFDAIPLTVEMERDGGPVTRFPALTDDGTSVSLTLADTQPDADLATRLGLRRLFALACADEVRYYVESHPAWDAMRSQHAPLGTPDELRDHLTCIIAERTFMDGQPAIRTRASFEDRRAASWGRLSAIARETCDAVARVLDARAQIARRFSGGTPRLWADSVADIREQAAYLMPPGFLAILRWEQLRRYPVWAEVMRERLLNLREDGSKSEGPALAAIAPHWKRFTGWVAAAMSAQRARADQPPPAGAAPRKTTKAPLPGAKRAAPTVNVNAAEWALRPGNLPAPIERYRWALEDFRVAALAPERAARPIITAAQLDKLWAATR